MTVQLSYDPQLSRVRVTATALPNPGELVTVERSRDGVRWTTLRGGLNLTVTAGGELPLPVDDYEFYPDELNTYRIKLGATSETATITPDLAGRPWLKIIARPFLNRPVTVLDYSDVSRPARAGVFDVVGTELPVVVSARRGSRRFELALLAESPAEARELETALLGGEVAFLHVPADCHIPGGYLHVGDVTISRPARRSRRRILSLPVVETAAPGPDVIGATSTWQTVLNTYPTWADVLAAHPTWADLLELIGDPEDVITE